YFSLPQCLEKRKISRWMVLVGRISFPLRDSVKINHGYPPRSSSAAGYLSTETAWRKQWLVERDHEGCLLGKAAVCVALGRCCGSNVFFSRAYRRHGFTGKAGCSGALDRLRLWSVVLLLEDRGALQTFAALRAADRVGVFKPFVH